MNIIDWLRSSQKILTESGVSTPLLDVEVLLAGALNKDRSWIHAHQDEEISDHLTRLNLASLDEMVARRAQHEPLAYIRGKQEFYGREFCVSPDTLTPRPETETMIELMLEHLSGERRAKSEEELQIVDVGTGSGCIVITAALELPEIQELRSMITYTGLDISAPALAIAKENAKKHDVDVDFREFNLLKEDLGSWILDLRGATKAANSRSKIQDPRSTIYLANLPYVPANRPINTAATHEPAFAIYGGEDGLDYYRELFAQLSGPQHRVDSTWHMGVAQKQKAPLSTTYYLPPTTVFTEALPEQHKELKAIAEKAGYSLLKTQDLIQVFTQNSNKT